MPSEIDINCDMGELPQLLADGTQQALLQYVTSVNIACGAHAGDQQTIVATAQAAANANVKIGAHPGYPDRENFGRIPLAFSAGQISDTVFQQLITFEEYIGALPISHVKPHGALYNVAVKDASVAKAIADGIRRWRRNSSISVMGLAGSQMLDVFRDSGFETLAEAFADRAYEPDGTLRSRHLPGAMIHSPVEAAAQAVKFAESGRVQTICIHSDTRGSVAIAAAVHAALTARTA